MTIKHRALDTDGKLLSMEDEEARANMERIISDPKSRILIAVYELDGLLAIQLNARPTPELLDVAEHIVASITAALQLTRN